MDAALIRIGKKSIHPYPIWPNPYYLIIRSVLLSVTWSIVKQLFLKGSPCYSIAVSVPVTLRQAHKQAIWLRNVVPSSNKDSEQRQVASQQCQVASLFLFYHPLTRKKSLSRDQIECPSFLYNRAVGKAVTFGPLGLEPSCMARLYKNDNPGIMSTGWTVYC